jgi:hypothetical protein
VTASAASALVDALAALATATKAVNAALGEIQGGAPATTREAVAQRTTGTQVLAALATAGEPLTLQDVADAIVAIRRGEDEPRRGGGTRYQEMCRNALSRLIERGLVERVEPETKRGLMRFRRVAP